MNVEEYTVPPEPQPVEKRYRLDLSEHEARVLRAVWGKSAGGPDAIRFLSRLDEFFPEDSAVSYAGISLVRIS